MPVTEASKKAIKKWRETHKDHYNSKQNEYTKKYYELNRDKRLEYAREYRIKQKELKDKIEKENI